MSTVRITIADVANAAGVSAMTVSNVVNGRPGASDSTRKRVLDVAEQLGYRPGGPAKQRRTGRRGLIGIVAVDLTSEFIHEILHGIAEEMVEDERELILNVSINADTEGQRIRQFASDLVDGLILIAPSLDDALRDELPTLPVPVVVIDPRQLELPVPRVTVTNYEGVRAGVEHLIALGHTRIAYIRGEEDHDSTEARRRGYLDAMKLADLEVPSGFEAEANFSYDNGFAVAKAVMESVHPSAIACGADLVALGAIDAARSLGLEVPADVSIVGFDDLPRATASFPQLTTVRQPLRDMGRAGARALLSLVNGQPLATEQIQLPTELVIRGTTAPPARA